MTRTTFRREGGPVFGFPPGRRIDRRYVLGDFIGAGWEGEVYHLTEASTGIGRVVKFFYPHRLPDPKRAVRLARKLHRLRDCDVVLQYHHEGSITTRGERVRYQVSDLAPGRSLSDWVDEQPKRRFHPFEALHLVHAIASGIAEIHALGEYHGDLHDDNVLIERRGLGFRVKTLDLYLHPGRKAELRREDVIDLVGMLYRLIGGPAVYRDAPELVRAVVCGRRRATLERKFPTAGALCAFMERFRESDG